MADGDEKALEAFYGATLGKAYGVALRIVRDEAIAEDVVTDVYYQAWSQAGRFDARRGRPLTWLLTICRSRALDRMRKSDRSELLMNSALEPSDEQAEAPDALLQSLERDSQIHASMANLSQAQRDAVALAYFRDMSHQQISDYLGLPLGTVKSHIRRALEAMRPDMMEQRA